MLVLRLVISYAETVHTLKFFKQSLTKGTNVVNGFSITGFLIFRERQAFTHCCELLRSEENVFPANFDTL